MTLMALYMFIPLCIYKSPKLLWRMRESSVLLFINIIWNLFYLCDAILMQGANSGEAVVGRMSRRPNNSNKKNCQKTSKDP